ncbi:MAG: GyrI-like domain-containing protein, partial [Coprobacillus cateniformis]
MKIEEFKNVTMIYMRHVGEYGLKNKELMETFKQFLKDNHLLNDQSVILGIALDNPQIVPADQLRYDVGLIVDETENDILPSRLIDDGKYAIFEVPHTAQGVQ